MRLFLNALSLALTAILRNKTRATLTVLGILIGVAAVVIVTALAGGASREVGSSIEGFGANALFRLAAAGRGAKAPPANPATTLAAAVSACRRDNIVAAQIRFADGECHGRCRECMGRTCGPPEPRPRIAALT